MPIPCALCYQVTGHCSLWAHEPSCWGWHSACSLQGREKTSRKELLSVSRGSRHGDLVKYEELALLYVKERSIQYWFLETVLPFLSTKAKMQLTWFWTCLT